MKKILALLAALALPALTQTAQAGMITDTVHVRYAFPDTTYYDLGTGTVDADGVSFDFYEFVTLTIADTRVRADFHTTSSWEAAPYNGFVVTDLAKSLPAFALNGASNMAGFGSGSFYVSGQDLYINWQGLAFDANTRVVLDAIPADVPEPFTLSLMGLGLLGLGMAQRRRK